MEAFSNQPVVQGSKYYQALWLLLRKAEWIMSTEEEHLSNVMSMESASTTR